MTVRKSGAAVIVTTNGEEMEEDGAQDASDERRGEVHVVTLGGSVPPSLAPAVAVIPMQLVAWRLSVDRGLDPTELRVASKVTTRE